MKTVNMISPVGDKISVTKDQVDYLISVGWKVETDKVVKSKVKIPKEVEQHGNI